MRTPRHFDERGFSRYILQCALRDRETFLEALTPPYGEPDAERRRDIEETKAEIDAMRNRLQRLSRSQ